MREQAEVTFGHDESHDLELELPDKPLRIDGDRARLAQVVGNVLSNAVKYSPDGGTITVGAAEAAGHARVWVADEGTGIAPEHRGQLFQPFYRGDAAAAGIPGTGLGLAVSRRIVEAHDGRIGFDPLTAARASGSTCRSRRRRTAAGERSRNGPLARRAWRREFLLAGLLGFVPGVTTHYGDLRFATHSQRAAFRRVPGVDPAQPCPSAARRDRDRVHRATALASLTLWLLGVLAAGAWLSLDTADNWLHFVLGVGLLGLGSVAGRAPARATTA